MRTANRSVLHWTLRLALASTASAWSTAGLRCSHAAPRPALPQPPPAAALAPPLRACVGMSDTAKSKVKCMEAASSDAEPLEIQQALQQTAYAVLAASAFCGGVLAFRGSTDASAWLAAYVLEESLSVDNLFVFTLIFDYFRTPAYAQPRVLRWGLIAAVILRACFICAGLAVIERFQGVLLLFSAVLLYSAYGILVGDDKEEEADLSDNGVVKFTQKYLPFPTSTEYNGDQFFTSSADGGATLATPLLLALVCVEISDVLFAVDSVPAVFGVTTDPFIALTSNAFALLGLRSLYTIIAQGIDQFHYLQTSIALVLGFIGVKLIAAFAGYEVDTVVSLAIVLATLGGGIGFSLLFPDEETEQH
ncbi:hypothetical protein AB1Y20_013491 [Prymnesium parvum]|uniref:Uncharacterized protein n=1 Tax=Prymnesium parvum TaxID=97485 RepID=A0AB34IJ73_PRYPA|mmetsp:Transcript_3396/g.8528  ORF Transcript_3396/g.8528 Transcript_3396/m.8528 type:complete len:363 (+) Transcript_3396:319-1407(+)